MLIEDAREEFERISAMNEVTDGEERAVELTEVAEIASDLKMKQTQHTKTCPICNTVSVQ
jgi:hypothetical protein